MTRWRSVTTPGGCYHLAMTDAELRSAVLALPVDERAGQAREIIASLDGAPDAGAEEAWVTEIERRAQQVADGTASLTDWTVVRERLEARLKARRASSTQR